MNHNFGIFLVFSPPQANFFDIFRLKNDFFFDFHDSERKISKIHDFFFVTTKNFLAETKKFIPAEGRFAVQAPELVQRSLSVTPHS